MLGACGDDGPAIPPEGSSGSSEGGTAPVTGSSTVVVDEGTSTGASTSTSTGASSEETGFDPPDPACGNGFVEDDEECDDANEVDDDECSNACQVPCGLQWSTLALGPTADSEIEGLHVTRDADDQIVVAGRLREITVEMDGTVIEGEDTVLVQSYESMGGGGGGMVWEQILASPDGDAFSAGVAVDAAGDVYVAATIDAADGGTAIEVTKLDAATGATTWVHDVDGAFPGEDERATGIAMGPDGQPVVAGQVRAGDGDDDVWVRKLDAESGDEVWTETHSGMGSGGFSTDDGGPVAIASDGSIHVLARLYESFSTQRGALLRFGPDGGPAQWVFQPDIAGTDQSFSLGPVAMGPDDLPVMSVLRANGATIGFWIYKVDADGEEVWSRERSDFEVRGAGTDWIVEGLASTGDELLVQGRYFNDQRLVSSTWWETWVTRLSPDGTARCQVLQQAEFRGLLPPSLLGFAVTSASDGSAVVTGLQASDEESALWLGSFRD